MMGREIGRVVRHRALPILCPANRLENLWAGVGCQAAVEDAMILTGQRIEAVAPGQRCVQAGELLFLMLCSGSSTRSTKTNVQWDARGGDMRVHPIKHHV